METTCSLALACNFTRTLSSAATVECAVPRFLSTHSSLPLSLCGLVLVLDRLICKVLIFHEQPRQLCAHQTTTHHLKWTLASCRMRHGAVYLQKTYHLILPWHAILRCNSRPFKSVQFCLLTSLLACGQFGTTRLCPVPILDKNCCKFIGHKLGTTVSLQWLVPQQAKTGQIPAMIFADVTDHKMTT